MSGDAEAEGVKTGSGKEGGREGTLQRQKEHEGRMDHWSRHCKEIVEGDGGMEDGEETVALVDCGVLRKRGRKRKRKKGDEDVTLKVRGV